MADAGLRRLEDLEAIRDLACRYAHHVWQRDVEGVIALFTEDGEMDTGERPPIRGRQALLAEYRRIFASSELQPFVHNHVIDIDGNSARGHCYLELRAVFAGRPVHGAGQYLDRYERTRTGWRFRSRTLRMGPLTPTAASTD